MRILFMGAGAIGSLYGWALGETGHDVRHYVRRRRVVELQDGLELDVLDGRRDPQQRRVRYAPQLVSACDPKDPYDLMLVSVHHQDLVAAAEQAARDAGDTPVVFFGDLWTGLHDVDSALSRSRYLWGYPSGSAIISDDSRSLTGALPRTVWFAETNGTESARLQRVASVFAAAGFRPRPQPAVEHWLQVRWAITACLAGAAAKAGGTQVLLARHDAFREGVLAVREGLLVCERRGIDVRAFGDARPFYMSAGNGARLLALALRRSEVARRAVEIRAADPQLAVMFTELLQTGHELRVPTPRLEALAPFVAGQGRG